jgi:hypothetical protein
LIVRLIIFLFMNRFRAVNIALPRVSGPCVCLAWPQHLQLPHGPQHALWAPVTSHSFRLQDTTHLPAKPADRIFWFVPNPFRSPDLPRNWSRDHGRRQEGGNHASTPPNSFFLWKANYKKISKYPKYQYHKLKLF